MQSIGIVGFAVLAAGFCLGACPEYDLTGDCWVDLDDLAALATEWMTGNRTEVHGCPRREA